MARRRLGRRAVPDPDRPAFDRPGPAPATPGHEGALTHRVRASARPTLPPPPGRFRRFLDRASSAASVRRSFRLGIIALVVGAIALGGGLLWSSRPSPADAARRPTDAARRPTDAARRPPDAARQSTVAPSVSPQSSNSPSPADVLRRLDDLREQAFARRDVGLLARVYVPGPLLDEDSVPATAARTRRMWVGGRSYGVPQRSGVKPVGRTVECPGDGAARAVDLALHWCRPWSRGRCRADRTAY